MLRLKLAKEESQEKYCKGIMGHKIPNKNDCVGGEREKMVHKESLDDPVENKSFEKNPCDMSPLNPECRSKPPQTPTLRIIKSHLNTVYGSKSPLAHVNPERENKPPQAPTLRVYLPSVKINPLKPL